jgi:hypothetical protein
LSTSVHGPDPRTLIQVILHGIWPAEGAAGPIRPGFDDVLTDAQLATLVRYIRSHFSDAPAWEAIPEAIAEARRGAS